MYLQMHILFYFLFVLAFKVCGYTSHQIYILISRYMCTIYCRVSYYLQVRGQDYGQGWDLRVEYLSLRVCSTYTFTLTTYFYQALFTGASQLTPPFRVLYLSLRACSSCTFTLTASFSALLAFICLMVFPVSVIHAASDSRLALLRSGILTSIEGAFDDNIGGSIAS